MTMASDMGVSDWGLSDMGYVLVIMITYLYTVIVSDYTPGLRIYPPPRPTFSAWKHDFSDLPPGEHGFFEKKKAPPLVLDLPPGYVFLPEISPGGLKVSGSGA